MPVFDIVILSRLNSKLRKRVLENSNVRKQIKTEINNVLGGINAIYSEKPKSYLFHSGFMGEKVDLSKFKYDNHRIVYNHSEILLQIDEIPNYRLKQVDNNGTMLNTYRIDLQNSKSDDINNMVYLMRLMQLKFGFDNFIHVPSLKINPIRTDIMQMINDSRKRAKITDIIDNPKGVMDTIIVIRYQEFKEREFLMFDVMQLRTYDPNPFY
jgi:hypothetical protein